MPTLDFWYDFASTYSYLSAMRIGRAAAACGVTVRYRPFLLGPIFAAQGWTTSPFNLLPAKGAHMWRDMERLCARARLPFRRPDPFPQNSVLAARLALVGLDEGWGERFTETVFAAEFGRGLDISSRETLGGLLRPLGLDPEDTIERALARSNKERLRIQTARAQETGIFGAPSFVTEGGELFWGDDRLDQALEWAVAELQSRR
ncbi:2-hydroxychromene-2-carboxylate isomerase [Lutibaculum baratangense]|uniref:2-hydroxychromene-2-carboxylate isomerase n=1 Tax=Lutibaculum baratangense AMV1 TaxID=631454 RepID=V4RLD1_9HYPH|nr:2-hydroxychromene-2-carboxylate isomerase [Lutibaculum baratangense]ESR26119.1 2-hydroxychromene-2-carboxylate isomerase [Lutibaculum baratangense AMV1]